MIPKKRHIRHIGRAFVAAGRRLLRNEVPRDAAAISYFALVALFPAIIVIVALVDAFLGWMNLHNRVLQRIVDLFPGSGPFLRSNLPEITAPSTAIVVSCVVVVLWSSSWIYTFIESAINRAWGVSHQRTFWESRLRSIALMALGGFSLLCSAATTGFVGAVRARASVFISRSAKAYYLMGWFWSFILLGAGLLIAVLVFAFVFKWIPHRRVSWRQAFSGALVSTILWEIGSFIFVKLMPFFDYQRVYGKMGAAIALLVWVYTSNLFLLFGAHFSVQLHWIRTEAPLPDSYRTAGDKLRDFPSYRP
jgi:membrane protein